MARSATTDADCFREFLERPQLEPLAFKDITKSNFCGTLIAGDPYRHLVAKHFREYPVLYIDLKVNCSVYTHKMCTEQSKDVLGHTYEEMMASFDELILQELNARGDLFRDGILDLRYQEWYQDVTKNPALLRENFFQMLSEALQAAYDQPVFVLIDEYDTPMHCAIENGYARTVWPLVPLFSE